MHCTSLETSCLSLPASLNFLSSGHLMIAYILNTCTYMWTVYRVHVRVDYARTHVYVNQPCTCTRSTMHSYVNMYTVHICICTCTVDNARTHTIFTYMYTVYKSVHNVCSYIVQSSKYVFRYKARTHDRNTCKPRGLSLAYPLRCRGYWIEYQ